MRVIYASDHRFWELKFSSGSHDISQAQKILLEWGAWIETFEAGSLSHEKSRRSPCGSVDWNRLGVGVRSLDWGRSPCGSVDWNLPERLSLRVLERRSPCGSVDWNIAPRIANAWKLWSLPVRERGLKPDIKCWRPSRITSLPVRERGLKQENLSSHRLWKSVAPRAGAWIETTQSHVPIPSL